MTSSAIGEIEMEQKYLICDEETFREVLGFIPRPPGKVGDYVVGSNEAKTRNYRYFDTFDGHLEGHELLAYIGQGSLEKEGISASFRAREDDFVFTVKIPTTDPAQREEYQGKLVPSQVPKWIKALRLMRGEEITADVPALSA